MSLREDVVAAAEAILRPRRSGKAESRTSPGTACTPCSRAKTAGTSRAFPCSDSTEVRD